MRLLPLAASAGDLVILVDTGTEMPMGRHMKRTPKFMSLPRKRVVKDGTVNAIVARYK